MRAKLELIAYVLHESGWKEVQRLGEFQILPRDAKPIERWQDKHAYWRGDRRRYSSLSRKTPAEQASQGT